MNMATQQINSIAFDNDKDWQIFRQGKHITASEATILLAYLSEDERIKALATDGITFCSLFNRKIQKRETLYQFYNKKRLNAKDYANWKSQTTTKAMMQGNASEDIVLEFFKRYYTIFDDATGQVYDYKTLDIKTRTNGRTVYYNDYFSATPDAFFTHKDYVNTFLNDGAEVLLELKTAIDKNDESNNELRFAYKVQVYLQMHLTGLQKAVICVAFKNDTDKDANGFSKIDGQPVFHTFDLSIEAHKNDYDAIIAELYKCHNKYQELCEKIANGREVLTPDNDIKNDMIMQAILNQGTFDWDNFYKVWQENATTKKELDIMVKTLKGGGVSINKKLVAPDGKEVKIKYEVTEVFYTDNEKLNLIEAQDKKIAKMYEDIAKLEQEKFDIASKTELDFYIKTSNFTVK